MMDSTSAWPRRRVWLVMVSNRGRWETNTRSPPPPFFMRAAPSGPAVKEWVERCKLTGFHCPDRGDSTRSPRRSWSRDQRPKASLAVRSRYVRSPTIPRPSGAQPL